MQSELLKKIEHDAALGNPCPKDVTAVESCLFIALKALYDSYHKQLIPREAAQAEKQRIVAQCEQLEEERQRVLKIYAERAEAIRKAGSLLSEIEKTANVADIALKACECIGLMTGDESFFKRQAVKIAENNDNAR